MLPRCCSSKKSGEMPAGRLLVFARRATGIVTCSMNLAVEIDACGTIERV